MSKSQIAHLPDSYDGAIDFFDLFRVLWSGKWLIIGAAFLAAVIALIVALMLPNIYRSEALLAPNNSEGAGRLSALAAQYGGLASLAGINLNSGSAGKTELGLGVLKSRKFISEFVARHDLLVPLMATEGWDSATGDLIIDQDVFDSASGKWVRDVKPPKNAIPSSQEAYEKFVDLMAVNQDKKTGFITLAVEHYSPLVAKQWVDWLIHDLNSSIMRQDVDEAEQAIEYLNAQIENTPIADLKNVFFRLIEEQTKTVMLAKVTDEYLLKTLDPAIVPELKSKPQRLLIIILSICFGSFLGILVVVVSAPLRQQKAG